MLEQRDTNKICLESRRQRGVGGFSLIEMLVAITLAGILTTVGVSSYQNIATSYRISGEINELLGDMQFARAEAIKEGQMVKICISSNAGAGGTPDCDGDTASGWHSGWIVFPVTSPAQAAPNGAPSVLRAQTAFGGHDTLADTSVGDPAIAVTFNREGLANQLKSGDAAGGNALITLHDSSGKSANTRCLLITSVGAMKVVRNDYPGCV